MNNSPSQVPVSPEQIFWVPRREFRTQNSNGYSHYVRTQTVLELKKFSRPVNTATPPSGAYPAVPQNQQQQHALSNPQVPRRFRTEKNNGDSHYVRTQTTLDLKKFERFAGTNNTATPPGAYRAAPQNQQNQHALSSPQFGCPVVARESSNGNGSTGFCSANSAKNYQVFVGNVPHHATDDILKVTI
jgi:hypothetical protein